MFLNGMAMTDQQDYREYLKERFSHLTTLINANHKESMDSNDRIEEHVAQTNGRVLDLEAKVAQLDLNDKLHIAECPAMPVIKDLEKDVRELKVEAITIWIKKHWKLSIAISVLLLYFSYSAFSFFSIQQIIDWIK